MSRLKICLAVLALALDSHPLQAEEAEHDGHAEEEGLLELSPEAHAAAAIELAAPAPRLFSRLVRATGEISLDPDRIARVGPRIGGRITRLSAGLGQTVRAGDALAQIDSVELGRAKANYLGDKSRLELAKSGYEREKRLQAKGISSEKELLEAEAAQREAQIELDSARSELLVLGVGDEELKALNPQDRDFSRFILRSPMSGRILEREAALGQMAEPASTLFVIAEFSEVWARINLPEKDLAHVRPGATVALRLSAYPGEEFGGVVGWIGSVLDERTRTAQATVVLGNAEGRLKPGMFLAAEIRATAADAVPVLALPTAAVQRMGGEEVVFVAAGERRFQRREVRIGRREGGYAELLEGVDAGTQVVVNGAFVLKSELSKDEMGHEH